MLKFLFVTLNKLHVDSFQILLVVHIVLVQILVHLGYVLAIWGHTICHSCSWHRSGPSCIGVRHPVHLPNGVWHKVLVQMGVHLIVRNSFLSGLRSFGYLPGRWCRHLYLRTTHFFFLGLFQRWWLLLFLIGHERWMLIILNCSQIQISSCMLLILSHNYILCRCFSCWNNSLLLNLLLRKVVVHVLIGHI